MCLLLFISNVVISSTKKRKIVVMTQMIDDFRWEETGLLKNSGNQSTNHPTMYSGRLNKKKNQQ